MPSSGLLGPYPLTSAEIDQRIDTTIATFALGRKDGHKFLVQHIGRADKDASDVLKALTSEYQYFKYRTYVSTRRAFAKECRLFHDFPGVQRRGHPEPPSGIRVKCPVAVCDRAD